MKTEECMRIVKCSLIITEENKTKALKHALEQY